MKQPSLLLKLAAVASALLLVGGFVSYRAGAFNRLLAPSPTSEEPAASEQSPSDTTQPAPTIFYGSKSGIFIDPASTSTPGAQTPATSQQPASDTTQPAPTIMGGYKSKTPLIVLPESNPPAAQPPAPSQPSKPSP